LVGSPKRRPGKVTALPLALLLLALTAASAHAAISPGKGGISATPSPPLETPPDAAAVYPIQGPYEYWDGFGGSRGHEGVDIGSPCGTPLVAVQAARVRYRKYHGAAGNYVVLDLKGSTVDLAYMHLSEPSVARPGQRVAAGQLLGYVGDTGNASGCHLHFEVWDGTWYGGGAPIDPMPFLSSLERAGKRVARQSSSRPRRSAR
jgi:murein DD-endopeptidase MepM/ murein hydrolase activator NlpD